MLRAKNEWHFYCFIAHGPNIPRTPTALAHGTASKRRDEPCQQWKWRCVFGCSCGAYPRAAFARAHSSLAPSSSWPVLSAPTFSAMAWMLRFSDWISLFCTTPAHVSLGGV